MKELKISYLIGVHNEGSAYLKPLFDLLLRFKDVNDEIIVVDDFSDEQTTKDILDEYSKKITIFHKKFEGDFANHKNYMISLCNNEYIFNIDADEIPAPTLLSVLKEILLENEHVDLFFLPRINIVKGLTQEDINAWRWVVNDRKWINYPDGQGRIFKKKEGIRWEGKIHEKIIGTEQHTMLPAFDEEGTPIPDYCLLHVKQIERQRQQNSLYSNLIS